MNKTATLVASLLLLAVPLSMSGQAAAKKAPPHRSKAASSPLDPQAMAALAASRAYLSTLNTAELRAEFTMDDVEPGGLKLEMIARTRYLWIKPNKLYIDWSSDRFVRKLYFDGQKATLFSPATGYYAQVQAPGTVADMLYNAARDYGIVFPLPDILLWAVKGSQPMEVQSAMTIGYARIAGVDTDQYVFRQHDLDWQVWIERGPHPLPRKIVITTRTEPTQPKVSALLQWNIAPTIPPGTFDFTPTAGTASIGIVKLQAEGK